MYVCMYVCVCVCVYIYAYVEICLFVCPSFSGLSVCTSPARGVLLLMPVVFSEMLLCDVFVKAASGTCSV